MSEQVSTTTPEQRKDALMGVRVSVFKSQGISIRDFARRAKMTRTRLTRLLEGTEDSTEEEFRTIQRVMSDYYMPRMIQRSIKRDNVRQGGNGMMPPGVKRVYKSIK